MPKQTFYNLPKGKARQIEQAAIEEFAAFPYKVASLNRIIQRAQIAKGSFYQYFADKKDLYRFILDRIIEKKMEFLSPVILHHQEMDFFTRIRHLYRSGLQFAKAHPQLQKIGHHLMFDRQNPVYKELVEDNRSKSDQIFETLLRQGIEKGDIRPDINVSMMAWLISHLNTSLADYYVEQVNPKLDDSYLETADQLIDFLRNGLGCKERDSHEASQ